MTLDLARIRALCFDVDGTLSDTDHLFARRLARWLPPWLFHEPGRSARRAVLWVDAPGNAFLSMADRLGMDSAMTVAIDWFNHHRRLPAVPANQGMQLRLVPGVDRMLRSLRGHYSMAVVSSRDERSTRAFLDQFELGEYFDVLVTRLSAAHTKPYPDPILLAAREMNVPPDHCLMIGDTTVDIRAGKAAGAQTVGVLCGFGGEGELRRMGADLILATTARLADVLLGAGRQSPSPLTNYHT